MKKKKIYIKRAIQIICVALIFTVMVFLDFPSGLKAIIFGNPNIPKDFGKTSALDIAFLDVDQGDCALIGANNTYIMIDAGENDKGYEILRYLDMLKVKKIDIMILTHPHSDHIGGADVIIESINVGKVYMPDEVLATSSFESVIDAIEENDIEILIPNVGDKLSLDGFELTFLHPECGKVYENINDVSIVAKVENIYGSALFAGDVEKIAESDMLLSGANLKADVLKVGHHGSSTSTTEEFLVAICPKNAVISCGEHNDFGHPHDEVIDMLESQDINYYITHEKGSVFFSFTESGLEINTER